MHQNPKYKVAITEQHIGKKMIDGTLSIALAASFITLIAKAILLRINMMPKANMPVIILNVQPVYFMTFPVNCHPIAITFKYTIFLWIQYRI